MEVSYLAQEESNNQASCTSIPGAATNLNKVVNVVLTGAADSVLEQ